MCRQIEALNERIAAAHALTRACHCRIDAISVSLHHAYDARLGDPVPDDMTALLSQVDASAEG